MSKKSSYYFTHDFNARNDERIVSVRMKHGIEGYGIYFALIELLAESTDYIRVRDYNIIAFDLRVDAAKIKTIIEDFGLFAFTDDGKCFYSESLRNRMNPLDELRQKKSEAGKKGNEKRWGKEEELPENQENDEKPLEKPLEKLPENQENDENIAKNGKCDKNSSQSNDFATLKNRKGDKGDKEDKEDISLSALRARETENENSEISNAEREIFFKILFFEKRIRNPNPEIDNFVFHYAARGWKDKGGAPIENREALLHTWVAKDAEKIPVSDKFMKCWHRMYILAKIQDVKNADLMISELERVNEDNEKIEIVCSEALMMLIENNSELFSEELIAFKGKKNLKYKLKK